MRTAYEALRRGRHHMFKFTLESLQRAKECFDEAIALDPTYAEAHTYLGLAYCFRATNGFWPMREAAAFIREEAQKALHLSPMETAPRSSWGW